MRRCGSFSLPPLPPRMLLHGILRPMFRDIGSDMDVAITTDESILHGHAGCNTVCTRFASPLVDSDPPFTFGMDVPWAITFAPPHNLRKRDERQYQGMP